MSYICLYEWLIFRVNIGKYTSPMDPLGSELVSFIFIFNQSLFSANDYIIGGLGF